MPSAKHYTHIAGAIGAYASIDARGALPTTPMLACVAVFTVGTART